MTLTEKDKVTIELTEREILLPDLVNKMESEGLREAVAQISLLPYLHYIGPDCDKRGDAG